MILLPVITVARVLEYLGTIAKISDDEKMFYRWATIRLIQPTVRVR